MKQSIIPFILALLCNAVVHAQSTKPWNGKQCAIVLTYDDAIDQHLDNAVPLLDSLHLKATFYITGFSSSMQKRLNEWKSLAAKGYELGNHTLYHPCIGNRPGREFVIPEYNLDNYTVRRMIDETRMTNLLLQALDGKTKRTFAFTCADTKIGDSSFIQPMRNDFVAARSVRNEMHSIKDIDLYNIDCYLVNNTTAEEMIGWVNKAVQTHSLLVILFHGVGGGNGLNIQLAEHRKFLQYLKQHEEDAWIAPMIEVAEHVKKWQAENK